MVCCFGQAINLLLLSVWLQIMTGGHFWLLGETIYKHVSKIQFGCSSQSHSNSTSMESDWIVYSDFDGTITTTDALDTLLDSCLGKEDRVKIDEGILSGQVG